MPGAGATGPVRPATVVGLLAENGLLEAPSGGRPENVTDAGVPTPPVDYRAAFTGHAVWLKAVIGIVMLPVRVSSTSPAAVTGPSASAPASGRPRAVVHRVFNGPPPRNPAGMPRGGLAAPVATASPLHPLAAFSVTPDDHALLEKLGQRCPRVFDDDYFGIGAGRGEQDAQAHFLALRNALILRACADAGQSRAPAALPDVGAITSPGALLQALVEGNPGLVLGEAGGGALSRQMLCSHLDRLRRAGVETLYLQHLQREVHQAQLDGYRPGRALPDALDRFLTALDTLHCGGPEPARAGFRALVTQARRAGMRVVALDIFASGHLHGCRNPVPQQVEKVKAYVGTQIIQADRPSPSSASAGGKWIALVEATHAGRFAGVSGLAPRTGAVSLHVRQEPGVAWQCQANEGQAAAYAMGCDYVLRAPPLPAAAVATPAVAGTAARRIEARLARPGDYLLALEEPTPQLWHRSRDGSVRCTPILRQGTALALAPGEGVSAAWASLRSRAFASVDDLRAALPSGMRDVGATAASRSP